jgi:hypothetical protein
MPRYARTRRGSIYKLDPLCDIGPCGAGGGAAKNLCPPIALAEARPH